MKKTFFTVLMIVMSLLIFANAIDSTLANKYLAIADIWGSIKYLHPKASEDDIDWNSAFVDAIKDFNIDSSDISLKLRVSAMLEKLNDPHTFLISDFENVLNNQKNSLQLENDIIYLKLNDYSPAKKAEQDSLIQEALKLTLTNKGLILDIRNFSSDLISFSDIIDRNKIVENLVMGEMDMPTYKSISYHGFPNDNSSRATVYTKNSNVKRYYASIDGIREKPEIPIVFIVNDRVIIPQKLIALGLNNKAHFLSTEKHVHNFGKTSKNDYCEIKAQLVYWNLDGKVYYSFINKVADDSLMGSNYYDIALEMLHCKDIFKLPTIQDFTRNKKEEFSSDNFPSTEERILALAKLYYVMNNFNPHQRLMRLSPKNNFKAILPEVISASDSLQYNLALAKYVNNLCDSHGFVNSKTFWKHFYSASFPFEIKKIDNKFYISKLYDEDYSFENKLNLGDEIVSMNGETLIDIFNNTKTHFSSSNLNGENHSVSRKMLNGLLEGKCLFSIANSESIRNIHLNRIEISEKYELMEAHQDTVQILENDIAYVNLSLLQVNRIQHMFDKIKDNKAVIFDMRGYPNHIIWSLAPHLTDDKKVLNSQFAIPIFNYVPFDYDSRAYLFDQEYTMGVGKKISTPIVILMNEKTMSQAEFTCLIIKELTGATLLGRQTAGANGNITFVRLPGNVSIGFTGMDPQDARGNSHQGTGLIPDIVVNRTLEGIKAGKDEELEKAIEFLKEQIGF